MEDNHLKAGRPAFNINTRKSNNFFLNLTISKEEIKINLKEIGKELTNYTERIVIETMEEVLGEDKFSNTCTCKRCLLDIATYSLNRLPAKYISSHEGEVRTKIQDFEGQLQVDAITIVTKAIETVSKSPRH
ncbi:MAG: late competence development ComFB family protein [Halanaerobiales bacterium]